MCYRRTAHADPKGAAAEPAECRDMRVPPAWSVRCPQVLILLDNTYIGRFWTTMEAWCAMMAATADGVRAASSAERRYTIACIHNAATTAQESSRQLVSLVSDKTPAQMRDILAKPDVAVTNNRDKEIFLPVVGQTDEHVRQMMAATRLDA